MLRSAQRRMLFAIVCVLQIAILNGRAQEPATKIDVNATVAKIVQARELAASYVTLADQSLKSNPSQHQRAYELYADAQSKYSGWDAYVASAMRAGKAKNLPNDAAYKQVSTDATQSGSEFINYVKQTTAAPQSKAVVAILSSLADLGLKLWTGVKKQIDSDRELAASNFEKATKWQKWDEIVKGGGAAPATAPSDKQNPK